MLPNAASMPASLSAASMWPTSLLPKIWLQPATNISAYAALIARIVAWARRGVQLRCIRSAGLFPLVGERTCGDADAAGFVLERLRFVQALERRDLDQKLV